MLPTTSLAVLNHTPYNIATAHTRVVEVVASHLVIGGLVSRHRVNEHINPYVGRDAVGRSTVASTIDHRLTHEPSSQLAIHPLIVSRGCLDIHTCIVQQLSCSSQPRQEPTNDQQRKRNATRKHGNTEGSMQASMEGNTEKLTTASFLPTAAAALQRPHSVSVVSGQWAIFFPSLPFPPFPLS